MTSFEQAKGFTKPINGNSVKYIPEDILDGQQKLAARRKISLILKSDATFEENRPIGDMIEVYNKSGFNKGGVWSTPKLLLEIDHDASSVSFTGRAGKRSTVPIEEIKLALQNNTFAETVQTAIDLLYDSIEDDIENMDHPESKTEDVDRTEDDSNEQLGDDADFSGCQGAGIVNASPGCDYLHREDRVQVY